MMTGQEFSKGLFGALQQHGFARRGSLMWLPGEATITLVGVQKGFGEQWFVNEGFWLKQLGRDEPDRIEQSHMYFRLERLFPQYREFILKAGDLAAEEQLSAYQRFLRVLVDEIAGDLKQLGTTEGLVDAYHAGRLTVGLMTKAAKELLASTT
ncbi:hypothetical protein [Bradyrhizobium algeriense]|uniref:hypothetical protein n=1 Tax=Bradyrhizobium algeriense TaxID=634784 RepID=UPI000D3CF858|nr:hypothetical protein [Bradyrhizobium algeriense]